MTDKPINITEENWNELSKSAWQCRDQAYVLGNTKVGSAAMSKEGIIYVGCNIEHPFRCHDVHAEVNAITSMVAAGHTKLQAILIVAERELFTPCGGCMDWIFQFGGASCLVAFQSKREGKIKTFRAEELMPYYPK